MRTSFFEVTRIERRGATRSHFQTRNFQAPRERTRARRWMGIIPITADHYASTYFHNDSLGMTISEGGHVSSTLQPGRVPRRGWHPRGKKRFPADVEKGCPRLVSSRLISFVRPSVRSLARSRPRCRSPSLLFLFPFPPFLPIPIAVHFPSTTIVTANLCVRLLLQEILIKRETGG